MRLGNSAVYRERFGKTHVPQWASREVITTTVCVGVPALVQLRNYPGTRTVPATRPGTYLGTHLGTRLQSSQYADMDNITRMAQLMVCRYSLRDCLPVEMERDGEI